MRPLALVTCLILAAAIGGCQGRPATGAPEGDTTVDFGAPPREGAVVATELTSGPPEEQTGGEPAPAEGEPPDQRAEERVAEAPPAGEPRGARGASGQVRSFVRSVSAGGRSSHVTGLEVPLGSVQLEVALAGDRVGRTESLASMAQRHNAVAGMNGSFFDAYSNRSVRNPYGNLIVEGEVVHASDRPTTLGWWADGTVAIGQVRFAFVGGTNGSMSYPNNWYAWGINDYPEGSSCAQIYTSRWGSAATPAGGSYALVRDGVVVATGTGAATIPADGFAVYLQGSEAYLASRFARGRQCEYRCQVKSASPSHDWLSAEGALGCGPQLVRDGAVAVDPSAEGFTDAKVLSGSGARSALGLTSDGRLLLVTCPGATMRQLGEAMKALGCRDAMNLDGGASSGLWLRGQYLTRPGRDISNALLILEKR